VAFSTLYTMTLVAGPGPRQLYGLLFWICMAVGACVARLCLPRSFQSPDIRPRPAEALARRVVVVNIDGCRLDRFRDARLPFLSGLASQGCSFPGGLETVYRALTNPAFASILTGATPAVHGITSNNLGQRIRVQALPDIVETKLYGSMHVKHFSKKHWDTFIVSLPVHSIYKSDDIMFEQMKKDLAAGVGTRLFVADISETDFLGHAYGSGSRRYREALMRADGRIAALYGWMRNNRMLGDCAFIVCSDHGIVQIDHSYLLFAAERYVPFIMTGPGVRAGSVIDYRASIMDIAPTISYMLGVSYPDHCRGRVFLDAFERAG
jgi:predicted AlkP superfamily pyrophosphatase or phosphodiesterase